MADVMIVGLFDRRADADRAAERLRRELDPAAAGVAVHQAPADAALPDALRLSALPAEERDLYREGLRRGGVPVSVAAEAVVLRRVVAILGECGAADLEAREAAWRSEGWTGGRGTESGFTGHDEDIGYATYGGDAVIGHIPRRHHDDTPAGLLGRLEMAAMEDEPGSAAPRHARVYAARRKAGDGGGHTGGIGL